MRRVYGKKAIYPSDIGCYTMAVGMGTVDTCLCMGASISLASGIRFGGETEGICASLGDSTFLHGGMTGLLNAAYNKARITVTILDNSTTAMTGGQPVPHLGVTAGGQPTKAIAIEPLVRAAGVDFLEVCDPYDGTTLAQTLQQADRHIRSENGSVAVVISRRPCIMSPGSKKTRKSVVMSISDECVGCGVCEMICPVEPAAIVVDAQAVWKEGVQ